MSQSKLVSFVPIMDNNGQQRQWNTAQYPDWNFDFTLTMENGDSGVSSTKNKAGVWTVGTEYVYDKEVDSQNRVKLKKVKSLEAAAKGGNYGGGNRGGAPYVSHYDSPEVQEAITKKFALQKSSEYLVLKEKAFEKEAEENPTHPSKSVTAEDISQLRDAMFAWCYNGIDLSSKVFAKDLLNRRSALEVAIIQIPIKSLLIEKWGMLAARADVHLEYLSPKPVPVPEPTV